MLVVDVGHQMLRIADGWPATFKDPSLSLCRRLHLSASVFRISCRLLRSAAEAGTDVLKRVSAEESGC